MISTCQWIFDRANRRMLGMRVQFAKREWNSFTAREYKVTGRAQRDLDKGMTEQAGKRYSSIIRAPINPRGRPAIGWLDTLAAAIRY